MTNTKIEKAVEEFEEKFVSELAPTGIKAVQSDYESIKNFLTQALLTAHKQGKKDAYSEILLEQHKNELESKGYDFYFAIRNKLDKLINQNND